jgi:hypothetical protein
MVEDIRIIPWFNPENRVIHIPNKWSSIMAFQEILGVERYQKSTIFAHYKKLDGFF